jgi:hypothetical protein
MWLERYFGDNHTDDSGAILFGQEQDGSTAGCLGSHN